MRQLVPVMPVVLPAALRFGGNLAYSKVQVECDVCRACTVQAAVATSRPRRRDPAERSGDVWRTVDGCEAKR